MPNGWAVVKYDTQCSILKCASASASSKNSPNNNFTTKKFQLYISILDIKLCFYTVNASFCHIMYCTTQPLSYTCYSEDCVKLVNFDLYIIYIDVSIYAIVYQFRHTVNYSWIVHKLQAIYCN